MSSNQQKSSIADKVIEKIKSGKIKMRPKIHFVLKTVFIALGIIIVSLFALYLISLIIFVLRANGVLYLPCFGFRGIKTFFTLLPWLLILIAIILIIILEILVKHFSFAYRRPIFYSVMAIIIIALLGSFIVDKTRFHSGLFQKAQESRLPVAGEFYRGFGKAKFRDVHRGAISEITENGFRLETRNDEILDIIITPDTRFPFGTDIKKDDVVMVFGERDNGAVQAFGVRKINDKLNFFPKRRMRALPDK